MSRQARVGLLVLAGVILFMIALFAIANRTFLFSDTFFVRSTFHNVSGLLSGASVQYQGVNVGRVERVLLPQRPGEKIVVDMAIQEKARHLVRKNTQAQIQSDGLVGNMIVVLLADPNPAGQIQEGETIPGVEPFSITAVTDQALSSVNRFNEAAETFQAIMTDVRNGEGTLGKVIYDPALYNTFVQTATETQQLMARLGDDAEALVGIAQGATAGLNSILAKVEGGEGTLGMLLNDPGAYERLNRAADTLLNVSTDIRNVTRNAEELTAWGALGAFRFAELMEAGKHNWLFKRYFEERGYQEQAPFEVREQAIRASYREIEERQRELYEWEQRLLQLEANIEESPRMDTLRAVSSND